MFGKKQEKPTPVRLHKVETNDKKPTLLEKYIVGLGIILGLLLLLLIFLIICTFIIPKTYGFYWW